MCRPGVGPQRAPSLALDCLVMSVLSRLFGRREAEALVVASADPREQTPARTWNTLSTLGIGPVADVDARGAIYPRRRSVSVEVWFGVGDRWLRGTSADGLRQRRVDGLPVIETRQRAGESDIVMTAWADESGDARGRVVLSLENETDTSVIAAIVVRPKSLVGAGTIHAARVSDSLIVVDQVPLIDLGRSAGDSVGAVDSDADTPAILARLSLSDDSVIGDELFEDAGGEASFAALIPLTAGSQRSIELIDGREASTVAPAPLDNVVSGWKAHLAGSAEIELPGWPKHLAPALTSGLLGAVSHEAAPLGDERWRPEDDTLLVAALGGVGLDWAASTIADRLLDRVTEGTLDRRAWPGLAVGLSRLADSPRGAEVLGRHGEAVVAVIGHCLSQARADALVPMLLRVIEVAHGPDAATDAAAITGTIGEEHSILLARHGVSIPEESISHVRATLERDSRSSADSIGLAMVAQATAGRRFEPVVPMRALAGATWRWPRDGCGDSPHARAALLVGLRSLCLTERAGAPISIDLFTGTSDSWFGQSMEFSNLPTAAGRLSAAVRWHGARPALLWELTDQLAPFEMRCERLDPTFGTSELSGETLLETPTGLSNDEGAG